MLSADIQPEKLTIANLLQWSKIPKYKKYIAIDRNRMKGEIMIRIYLVFGMLLAAQLSYAQGGMGAPQQEFIPDVDSESLIFQVPSKWYPYYRTTDAKVDTFMFPTGQEPEDWKEALQSERFLTTLGVTSAIQVYEFRTQGTSCITHDASISKEANENGYSMVQWVETCSRADESVVVTLGKSIVGNERLYVMNKIWKYNPRESDMSEWERYMDEVYVCDPTTDGANPCRPPNRAAGDRPRR